MRSVRRVGTGKRLWALLFTFLIAEVTQHLNLKSVKTHFPTQRISIDFPKNILQEIDIEAAKIGVTRTSLIKMWVAEHLHPNHY